MQSANQPSILTVLPQHHSLQYQLCLLSIMCPKTKYHPLLASATRLPPVFLPHHMGGEQKKEGASWGRMHSFSWKYNSRSV